MLWLAKVIEVNIFVGNIRKALQDISPDSSQGVILI
jgi:hypothetical protein